MQELFRSCFKSKWVSGIFPQKDNWQNRCICLLVSSFPIRPCLLRLTPQASFQIILLLCAHKLKPTIIKGWLSPPRAYVTSLVKWVKSIYPIVLFCISLCLLGITYLYFYSICFKYIFIKETLLLHEEFTLVLKFFYVKVTVPCTPQKALTMFLLLFSYVYTHVHIYTCICTHMHMYIQNSSIPVNGCFEKNQWGSSDNGTFRV